MKLTIIMFYFAIFMQLFLYGALVDHFLFNKHLQENSQEDLFYRLYKIFEFTPITILLFLLYLRN